ncbi:gastrokine-2-like isoform X2 [Aquarana catesbeiana]|uniref:gastrokine-2-like isoform X2 n=1 Tax=Aquarana catesbeiana TaxID=8400 RepID=UPI003CC94DAC
MEEKATKNSDGDLPPYSLFPSTKQPKKKWIVGVSVALVLVLITVVSTLIGVYMTQKHTETMVMMKLNSQDGHNFQQTILVNEQEDVAVFIVHKNNFSSAILFDYKRRIIGMRTSNSTICQLLRMDDVQTPSIPEILKMIRIFQNNNTPPSEKITYNIIPVKEANQVNLGMNMNILCSDVPIYWSKMVDLRERKVHGNITVDIQVGCFRVTCTISW